MSTLKIRLDWLLLVCLYTRPKAPTMEAQTRSSGWLEPDINSGKCRFLSWMPANYNVTTHLDPGFGSLLSAVNPVCFDIPLGFWLGLACFSLTWNLISCSFSHQIHVSHGVLLFLFSVVSIGTLTELCRKLGAKGVQVEELMSADTETLDFISYVVTGYFCPSTSVFSLNFGWIPLPPHILGFPILFLYFLPINSLSIGQCSGLPF